jgi:hypothetical protein
MVPIAKALGHLVKQFGLKKQSQGHKVLAFTYFKLLHCEP